MRLPLPELVRRAVPLRITLVVAVPAVRGGLHDHGTASGARGLDDRGHRGGGGDDVVAVDRDVLEAVTDRALLERRRVLRVGRRELGVAVVLAEEDHRQLPDRGEVDRLVERAGRHRAVTEERHRDAAVAPQLRRGRGADRDRKPGPHDPVGAEDADHRVGDVHRATPPAVRAGVLGHQLGQHPGRVEALGEAVAVAAVGRRDHVGRARAASTRPPPTPPARSTGARSRGSRRRGTARPPAPRSRGSRACAGAS